MIVAGGQSDLGLDSRTGQALPRGQTEPPRTWLTRLRTLSPLPTLDCVLIASGSSASGPSVWAPLGLLPQESSGALLFLMVFLGFLYAPLSGRARKALRVAGEGASLCPAASAASRAILVSEALVFGGEIQSPGAGRWEEAGQPGRCPR